MGVELKGDLTVETVVDEEFGGVNGTLAGRLMGIVADAAVISEPSFLRICPAQRGGRTVHLTFSAPNDGVLGRREGPECRGAIAGVPRLHWRSSVSTGASSRHGHTLYAHLEDPVPVNVTRIFTAPWGMSEPTNTPSTCRVELFWQAMPGESLADIDHAFTDLAPHVVDTSGISLSDSMVAWLGDCGRSCAGV